MKDTTYIRLLTDKKLNEKQQEIWHLLVEKFLGPGTQPIFNDPTIDRQDDQFIGDDEFPYVYVVYLPTDINPDEVEIVVKIWNEIYPRDFEIETSFGSSLDCISDECIEIDDELHEEIQRRASKFLHNRWVEDKLMNGWRYGLIKNEIRKTDPRLRDWESLNENYRVIIPMSKDQAKNFLICFPHLFV